MSCLGALRSFLDELVCKAFHTIIEAYFEASKASTVQVKTERF